MASSITKVAASQNVVMYYFANVGGADSSARTQAQMISDCAAGPLKAFLQSLTTAQFNELGFDPRILVTIRLSGAVGPVRADFTAGSFACAAVDDADSYVTVEFRHSLIR